MKLKKSQAEAFVRDLQALTEKHGVVISACGCCDSPRLESIDEMEEQTGAQELGWDIDSRAYNLNRAAAQYAKED